MALTREFMEAVSQGNVLRVKIMLKDSLLVDTSFDQFHEMIRYAEPRLDGIWVNDEEDKEIFSESPEEFNAVLVGLVNHFSRRRVNHVKGMINQLYQPRSGVKRAYEREIAAALQKTSGFLDEYRGIIDDRKKMKEICVRISGAPQVDIKDIRQLRAAAQDIVAHCDKIMGR